MHCKMIFMSGVRSEKLSRKSIHLPKKLESYRSVGDIIYLASGTDLEE